MPSTSAVIYARISFDPDGDQLGVTHQLEECRELAAAQSLQVVGEFVDDDKSAMGKVHRPEYQELCEWLAVHPGATLIAWHPDRVTRSPRELEDLIALLERTRTKVVTVQAGLIDLATSTGRMSARIVGAVARQESEHKAERMRSKYAQQARSGERKIGPQRAYGYTADGAALVAEEVAVIRDVAQRLLGGESLHSVTRSLNRGLVSTVQGRAWSTQTVRNMVTNPRMVGARTYHGEIVSRDVYPKVLDQATFDRLRVLLLDPARRMNGGTARKYLLTGFMVCGKCAEAMVARPRYRGKDKPREAMYVCSTSHHIDPATGLGGCGRLSVHAANAEQAISDAVLEVLSNPATREAIIAADAAQRTAGSAVDDAAIGVELRDLDARDAALATQWATGDLSDAAWSAARAALNERRAKLVSAVRQRTPNTPAALLRLLDPTPLTSRARRVPSREETWEALGFDERRTVISAMIETIEVASAASPDPARTGERLTVTWRR